MPPFNTAAVGALVAVVAVTGATVAVALGRITGEAYVAIVTGFGGAGVGVGAHAAGVTSGTVAETTGARSTTEGPGA